MIIIFWAVIFFMTGLAIIWILPTRQSSYAVPKSVKVLVVFFLPVFALTLYSYLGNSRGLFYSWILNRQEKMVKSTLSNIKNPQQLLDRLRSYLEKNPNNTQAWYLLGKLYYGQRNYAKAVLVLKKAHQQMPRQASYAIAYAEASFFDNSQQLNSSTQALLSHVLKHNKRNVGALNLLAINAYFQGQYRIAIQYWERLLPLFPAGSKDQKFLLSMISKSQKKEN